MANEKNLVPFTSEQNREEARKNGAKGGKASAAARQRKKAMRQAAATLLNTAVLDAEGEAINEIRNKLKSFGLNENESTFQDAVLVSVMIKALQGDVQASQFLRDTAGDSPSLEIRKEELKIKKAELALKRKAILDDSRPDRDENNLFDTIKSVEEITTDDLPEIE